MTHRFNINFTDSAWEVTEGLARDLDAERAEVIREALSMYWWAAREVKADSIHLIIRAGDTWPTEITFPSLEKIRPMKPPKGPTVRDRLRAWFASPDVRLSPDPD